MIRKHLRTIAEMEEFGVVYMLKNANYDVMASTYKIFASFVDEGLSVITDIISPYLREQGRLLVCEEKTEDDKSNIINPIVCVQNLLDLKDNFDRFLHHSFDNAKQFQNIITSDFEYILNLNSNFPEYLSLFIDHTVEKNSKAVSKRVVFPRNTNNIMSHSVGFCLTHW